MFLNIVLPILLYIFGIILLVVLIILSLRLIALTEKIDKLTDEVKVKMNSFDNLLTVIDKTTDGLALISDKLVANIAGFVVGMFKKRKRKKENIDE